MGRIENAVSQKTANMPKSLTKAYRLIGKERIDEYSADFLRLRHMATGLDVIRVLTDDDEMFFSFVFDTPPENDKGTTHILEHSLLSGSKSYDVPEPFEICASQCALSYVNAETHQLWTSFPVASTVYKDFESAFKLYADCVFNPLLRRETFLKEGVRYSLGDDGVINGISGIVCNEMKEGELESGKRLFDGYKRLVAKGAESFESGGNSLCIPFLSYEEFIGYYKKHYRPENCLLIVYGGNKCDKLLEILDKTVLNKPLACDYLEASGDDELKYDFPEYAEFVRNFGDGAGMGYKQSETGGFLEVKYCSGSMSKPSFHMVFDTGIDVSDPIGLRMASVLSQALLGSYKSPLYEALLKLRLAKDVGDDTGVSLYNGKLYFTISLDGLLIDGSSEEIVSACENKIRALLSGFDMSGKVVRYLKNAIKTMKIEALDRTSNPMGRRITSLIMQSQAKDLSLCGFYASICEIEKRLKSDKTVFGRMFDMIFRSPAVIYHKMLLVPSCSYEVEHDKLADDIIGFLNEKCDKRMLAADGKLFEESDKGVGISAEDSKGMFELEPIDSIVKMMRFPNTVSCLIDEESMRDVNGWKKGLTFESYGDSEKGIAVFTRDDSVLLSNFNMAFRLDGLSEDEVCYLQVLSECLGRAKVNGVRGFHERFQSVFHSFSMHATALRSVSDAKSDFPCFVVRFKALAEDTEECFDLLFNLLRDAVITQKEVRDSVLSLQSEYADVSYMAQGFSNVMSDSIIDSAALFKNAASGVLFKLRIDSLDIRKKNVCDEVLDAVRRIYAKVFRRSGMVISLFSNEFPQKAVLDFSNRLGDSCIAVSENGGSEGGVMRSNMLQLAGKYKADEQAMRFARYAGGLLSYYRIKSTVTYPSMSIRCRPHSSALDVMASYFQDVALYEAVRVDGGAYGAYFDYNYYGGMVRISSIRDPNGINSFKSFLKAVGRWFGPSDLKSAKRAALVSISYPQSDESKAFLYFSRFLQNITDEARRKRVDDALKVKLSECRSAVRELFRKHMLVDGGKSYAILGNEASLDAKSAFINGFFDIVEFDNRKRAVKRRAQAEQESKDKK